MFSHASFQVVRKYLRNTFPLLFSCISMDQTSPIHCSFKLQANYLRRRMLISRLEFERTVDGRSLVHTNAAEEQRESISQILTDDLERSVAEDKDLNTSLLEAKRRLNAEIIQ